MKKLRITVDGKVYDVTVETLEDNSSAPTNRTTQAAAPVSSAPVQAPASTPASAPKVTAAAGDVPSPLAGKIVSVEAKVGQAVKQGDPLLTLEAMKMNTIIFSPGEGTVTAILVTPGQAVQEGEGLVTLG